MNNGVVIRSHVQPAPIFHLVTGEGELQSWMPRSGRPAVNSAVERERAVRSRRTARDAGTRFERLIADYLAAALDDDRIDRRARSGAKDRGDIGGVRAFTGERIVIEAKDAAAMRLSEWLREARVEAENDAAPIAIVCHKRRGVTEPGQQYVSMTLADLVLLLGAGGSS